MNEPREWTVDEVREKFLEAVRRRVEYWEKETRVASVRDRLDGLAFTILAMLDGSSMEMPGFVLIPCPHEDDKKYLQSQGENWYRPIKTELVEALGDISGSLHDRYYRTEDADAHPER